MPATSPWPPNYFLRVDNSPDENFYHPPRLVVHIDDRAIATLGRILAELLPETGHILDLMSSWRSHLPQTIKPTAVTGLGMNAAEMADNPQLDDFHIHNLNQNPQLPFADGAFDAVICTVSVQYLTQPVAVFGEVYRVLQPGGVFIVSFSNRCFQQKAVAIWLSTDDEAHLELVSRYFLDSAPWSDVQLARHPSVVENGLLTDPLYAVWAYKPATK